MAATGTEGFQILGMIPSLKEPTFYLVLRARFKAGLLLRGHIDK
jgi:hypothetical protein